MSRRAGCGAAQGLPSKRVSHGSDGELPAATILAALPADWCGHEAEIARLALIETGVEEVYACLDEIGMVPVDGGGWVVQPAGHEKLERAMDLLAGFARKP